MRKFLMIMAVAACLGLTGCAGSKLMQPVDPAAMPSTLSQDESAIVFFRATHFGGAVQAPVADVTDDKLEHVAVVSAKMKVLHKTAPGKHFYLVGGESSELLEADLEGGKIYYVYISPRLGWWKARFVFVPVTKKDLETDRFKEDLAWCEWHTNAPEAEAWFRDNLPSMKAKRADAYKRHNEANAEDRKILRPEDGTRVFNDKRP
jgi:hypothetical protein